MPERSENGGQPSPDGPRAAVAREFERLLGQRLQAGLYLVATPIGHLGDMTLRALAVLINADHVYCEDTRVSQKLLARFAIDRRMATYHEHNGEKVRPEILQALSDGRAVALISDAGTPAISDPGFKLVRAASAAGHLVVAIPGATAAIAALSASGLATDRFVYVGFLAPKTTARRQQLADLAGLAMTTVFYESPHRLAATLKDMAEVLGERPAVVARELTKKYEEIKRGTLGELAGWAQDVAPRGEVTIVVGAGDTSDVGVVDDDEIARRLQQALETASPAQAAKQVADALGVAKARVYDIGLKLKRGEM